MPPPMTVGNEKMAVFVTTCHTTKPHTVLTPHSVVLDHRRRTWAASLVWTMTPGAWGLCT